MIYNIITAIWNIAITIEEKVRPKPLPTVPPNTFDLLPKCPDTIPEWMSEPHGRPRP